MDKIITQSSASDEEILRLENEVLSFYRLDGAIKREHRKSLNVQEDKSEKINFYEDARTLLDKFLYMGDGYETAREAYRLFLLGAQDCPKCLFGVGLCLYRGYGVSADGDLGLQILKDAMPAIEKMGNDNEALVIMFEYYEQGYGVSTQHKKAISYLSRAACPRGYFLMAEYSGTDAEGFLQRAIEAKFPPAHFASGCFYRYGSYGKNSNKSKKDLEKAKSFFESGKKLGCKKCNDALSELSFVDKGFIIEDGVLVSCTSNEKTVRIPDIVTSIGENALRKLKATTLFLPDSVTTLPDNAFDINYVPDIISAHVNGKAYRAKVRRDNLKRSINSAGGSVLSTCKSHPLHALSIVSFFLLCLLSLVNHLSGSFPISLPGLTPMIAYGICLIVMTTVAIWSNIVQKCKTWCFVTSIVGVTAGLFFLLYGGIINEQWFFIPIATELIVASIICCFGILSNFAPASWLSIPIFLVGLIIIFGGLWTGIFYLCIPNIILVFFPYTGIALCSIIAPINLISSGEKPSAVNFILCALGALISVVGICFSGSFVWWGHVIAFVVGECLITPTIMRLSIFD